jgi:hypothetical protein
VQLQNITTNEIIAELTEISASLLDVLCRPHALKKGTVSTEKAALQNKMITLRSNIEAALSAENTDKILLWTREWRTMVIRIRELDSL